MTSTILNANNHLLNLARQGKRLFPIWVVIPVAVLIPLLSSFGAICLILYNLATRVSDFSNLATLDAEEITAILLPQSAIEQMLFLWSSFAGIFLLIWLWVRFAEGRPFKTVGLEPAGGLLKFGRGFGIGFVMFAISVVPLLPFGLFSISVGPTFTPKVVLGVLIVLFGWLVQGSAEELVFRGWMLPVLAARYKVWVGLIISSVTFALLHSLNPNLSVIAMLNLFLFGLFAALYALFEGGIWGVFGVHVVWNWVQGNIFLSPVTVSMFIYAPCSGMLYQLGPKYMYRLFWELSQEWVIVFRAIVGAG